MTTRTNDDSTKRDRSPTQDRGAAGSVLQALCDLGLQLTPPESLPRPRPTPPAFLPARPGKASRHEAGTGYIDVRALAAQVRRSAASTSTEPASPIRAASPAGPTTSDRLPEPRPLAAAPFAFSARRSQIHAFLLGVVCTGALLGSLLVHHATGSRTDVPAPDSTTGQQPADTPHR